jgi:NADPH:quinone reductase-like Zn-dependent oxidoreductase
MQAIIWTRYGPPDVLELQTIAKPVPKDDQVLIKIHAATVTAGDCEARGLRFPLWLRLPMRLYIGLRKPTRVRVLGMELAGEIEAVGKDVTTFKPGDAVFAMTDLSFGAYAEYKCMAGKPSLAVMAHKPTNLSFEEAAAVPLGGLESLHFLQMARIRPGDTVLINGAGGSIGTFGVQLAKYFGAEVTAVDSTGKLEMLRTLGADHVVDYTREDFATRGETYDVVFDVVGRASFSRCVRVLKSGGRYLMANPTPSTMLRGRWVSATTDKKVFFRPADHKVEDLIFLRNLAEASVIKPVIDRCYELADVPAAHGYVETGQKKGCVVITMKGMDGASGSEESS